MAQFWIRTSSTHTHTKRSIPRKKCSLVLWTKRKGPSVFWTVQFSTYLNIVFKDLRNRRQEPQVALYRRQLQCKKIIPQQGESLAARTKHFLQHENIMFLSLLRIRQYQRILAQLLWNVLLGGCFIYNIDSWNTRYTFQARSWTPFCLHSCLNSLQHRLKLLETFLSLWSPLTWKHHTVSADLSANHISDANLRLHHIPKVFYWIEI